MKASIPPTCRVIRNEPMSRHTSWRAGGCAAFYALPQTLEALQSLLHRIDKTEKIEWLGLGSNTLVRDGGFNGWIIATQHVMNDIHWLDNNRVYVGAGVADAKLARMCQQKGLTGAEFFAGIPGLIGGALAMNAGAWGSDTWSHVINVETMNRQGEIRQRQRDEFAVSYRHVGNRQGEWFIGATMQFDDNKNTVACDSNEVINIRQLLAQRADSQPTGMASCGSVFRNPDADYAARLIESCGLKGKRSGGAVVSEKHANFIINDHHASAGDIESLIETIQQTVQQQTGISLQTEVRIIGEQAK